MSAPPLFEHARGHRGVVHGSHGPRRSQYAEGDVVVLDDAACQVRLGLRPGVYVVQAVRPVGVAPYGFSYRLRAVGTDGVPAGRVVGEFLSFADDGVCRDGLRDDCACWELLAGCEGEPARGQSAAMSA